MRVIVTGNCGYVGTVLTGLLRASGHEVTGIDAGLYRGATLAPVPAVPTLDQDVRDVEVRDLAGAEALIHLAGLSNDPLGNLDPDLTYAINYKASVRLAEVAKRAGVRRFLFASSCSVYGAAEDRLLTEASELAPVTAYARSKALAETAIAPLADDRFSPVFLRPATAYGYSPMIRFDLVVNNLVAWATATGRVLIKSDGTPWRPVVHVEDIARAFDALLVAPTERVRGQAFNVGVPGENYRVCELAEIVREVVPGTAVEFAADAAPDRRCYRVNFGKLTGTVAAYHPRWRVAAGARQVYTMIRDRGLRREDFEGARYNRLDHLTALLGAGRLAPDLRWRPAPTGGLRPGVGVA